tara:strand:+ start:8123 stop:8332 length:210 start_codon:yes stop_codon:yes gene_type:complete
MKSIEIIFDDQMITNPFSRFKYCKIKKKKEICKYRCSIFVNYYLIIKKTNKKKIKLKKNDTTTENNKFY